MTKATLSILGTLVFVPSLPALSVGPDQFGSTITVSVYDRAHTQPRTLKEAERIAADIFAAAGVSLHWWTRSVSGAMVMEQDFSATGGIPCSEPLTSSSVQVQILPHAPNGFSPQALAYSLPCATRGIQITVYLDRVETVSHQTRATPSRVLGYTLAHELGHVLLRSLTHEKNGLMKGVWSKSDWQRAAVANIFFTPDETVRMKRWLDRIESHDSLLLRAEADRRNSVP